MAGTPDRVPVCAQLHEFAMMEIGVDAKEFYTNAAMLAKGTLEIQQRYGIDVPVLDLKRRVCPGFVEGQDPDVEKLGPVFYKKYAVKYGLPLILGIGAVFLATATPAEVTQRVRHYIEEGGENGRFALYLCNLGATTPAANVRAAVAAVRKYGTY